MDTEQKFSLLYKEADGSVTAFYPRTLPSQVVVSHGENVADHINRSELHLSSAEADFMHSENKPFGILRLDKNGYIPKQNLADYILPIRMEFENTTELLEKGYSVHPGRMVMVNDTSDDPGSKLAGWGIYYRIPNVDDFTNLDTAWVRVLYQNHPKIIHKWTDIENVPEANEVDVMVPLRHSHQDLEALNGLSMDDEGNLLYHGKAILFAEDKPTTKIFDTDYFPDEIAKEGDLWLKPSYGRPYWYDKKVLFINSGFELFKDNIDMEAAPEYRTWKVTNMNKMFMNCSSLTMVPQYYCDKVTVFSRKFSGCTSLYQVPCMNTKSGRDFSYMFEQCTSLHHSPEMVLNEAVDTSHMYEGDKSLIYILPFESTAKDANMQGMFNGCENLKKIYDPIDFSGITQDSMLTDMFKDCVSLEKMSFVENTLKCSLDLSYTILNKDSLEAILKGLPEVTGKTLNLTSVSSLKEISSDLLTEVENKGWTIQGK